MLLSAVSAIAQELRDILRDSPESSGSHTLSRSFGVMICTVAALLVVALGLGVTWL